MATHRENSRTDWTNATPDRESVKVGSMQRIADAVEVMSRNHAQLIADRERYERWWKEERERRRTADRRASALRGVITRMKRAGFRKRK